jgi:hypothetical protein
MIRAVTNREICDSCRHKGMIFLVPTCLAYSPHAMKVWRRLGGCPLHEGADTTGVPSKETPVKIKKGSPYQRMLSSKPDHEQKANRR